jgi:acetyltransferase-like isoleucine patch superfamily enzyme
MLKKIKGKLNAAHNLFFFRLVNFYLPNFKKINSNHVLYKNVPSCQQYTKITGLGKVEIGKNCSFGYKLGGFNKGGHIEIQPRLPSAKIKIGDNVATNNNIFICAANNIEIGKNTLIGQNVTIMDFEAHGIAPDQRRKMGKIGQVILGENIWIGNNVTILKNSSIGDNSIVAAGAVVTGHFPANVIIGGVPARTIKQL